MADQNKVEFKVRVTDEGLPKLAENLQKVEGRTDELGRSAGRVTGALSSLKATALAAGSAIAAYFGVRLFSGAVSGAAELEAKLSEVRAVSGASADAMDRLRSAAESAGATTRYTATEAAGALGNLARAGQDAEQSIAALPGTLALAQAGNIALEESASIVTRALAGFGLEADRSGVVADVLAKGANSANTNVLGLAQALSYAAPTAQSLGLSLETTVAIIGKFADAGIDASRAGTALNAILAQFSDPASKFRLELADIGITTSDFEEALRQMAQAGPGAQKALLAVGTEAGPALRALLNQGIGALDELKGKLLDAQGAAAATAATMEDNLPGAMRGLGSAWDTVKNALATPVLPVLKDGVTQLANALRGVVSDGTVGRFGEAIAKGFQAALEWARSFLAEVDFAELATRAGNAADQVGQAFDRLSSAAKSAGDSVRLVWGVATAGASGVLTAIYGVGTAFTGVAADIMLAGEKIFGALAKVSFGPISAAYKAASDEMALAAGGLRAASDAMADQALKSLSDMAQGAELARSGWAGLTGASDEAASRLNVSQRVIEETASSLRELGGDAEAAGMKSKAAGVLQTEAMRLAREEAGRLKKEYEAALAAGDVQTAVAKLAKMQQALKTTADQAKLTGQDVANAFARMGVQTQEQLRNTAASAQRDYEIIKESGEATADGLQQAFRRYADAAISANGGVATEAIKAEARMRGLEVTSDETGKTIVRSMGAAKRATTDVGGAADGAAAGFRDMAAAAAEAGRAAAAAVEWADRLAERNGQVGKMPPAGRRGRNGEELGEGVTEVGSGGQYRNRNGMASDAKGNPIGAGTDLGTLTGIKNFLQQAGLDEAQAKKLALEFSDGKGNIPYFSNPGQMRYGGETLSAALLKAAEKTTFGAASGAGAAAPVGSNHTVHVNLGAGRNLKFNAASEKDAAEAADIFKQIESAAKRSR